MKKITNWLGAHWRPLLLGTASFAILFLVGLYNLESITNGNLSNQEVVALKNAASGKDILADPLNLPFKLGQYALMSLGNTSVFFARSVTVVFGFIMIVLFYALARHWFSPRIAWISTLMFATSSMYLNYSRLAVPDILTPLALCGLMASAWWLNTTKHIRTALLGCTFIIASAIYIPGIIWFVALVLFVQRKHIISFTKRLPAYSTIGFIFLGILLLSPLLRAIILQPKVGLAWLALPETFNFATILRDLIYVPLSLTVRSLSNPVFNLGRLPYIDILTLCLIILGTYALTLRNGLVRTRTLIGATIISWILIGISNRISIILLLPLIFLMVASGIMLLLHQWFSVFPKNPIARTIGISLLLLVVSISIFYNTTRYFVAWANSPVTKSVFQEKIPPNLVQ